MSTYRIGYLVGSLAKGSINRKLAKALIRVAPEKLHFHEISFADLPLYSYDYDADYPAAANDFKAAIKGSDAILFVTPEYNRSIPGVLKNAIDWASRLSPQPFAGKPVSLMSASMGILGGARMQYHLRQILVFLDAEPMNKPEVFIGAVHQKVTDGQLSDPGTRAFLADHMTAFATWTRRRKD